MKLIVPSHLPTVNDRHRRQYCPAETARGRTSNRSNPDEGPDHSS
ncbi:hypothetical protein AB0K20_30285 [Micromonospora matsumotoense]